MGKKFSYQSDDYDRQAQRFVIPLYIKNNLENYQYSSTGTFVTYNEHHYIIFAAHALEKDINVNDIYTFAVDGTLHKILENSIGYQVFQEEDIVIVDHFNNAFDGKNYFNLNIDSLIGFDKKHFAWTGFPNSKTKAKIIHKTKSKEILEKEHIHSDDSAKYFKNTKYFTILSRLINQNKNFIFGKYNRKDTNLKYQGDVSMAPHPRGMSGGAMYFFTKERKLKETLDDTFRFAGIGLEYKNNKSIIGISRNKIIELIDIFNRESPVELIFQEPSSLKT
jgi:hypothetical protein